MDPERPSNQLTLVATSIAEDLGFVALSDLADVFVKAKGEARLIGGQMVTLHAQRWKLGQELYRETHDADLGIARMLVNQWNPVEMLLEKGYAKVSSNRLVKSEGEAKSQQQDRQVLIDILLPALRTRARPSVRVGDLATSEVPGLAEALLRDPVMVHLEMHRLNKDVVHAKVPLPDEPSALVLKALAWQQRQAAKDAVDMWRCLEIASAAGLGPESFNSAAAHSAKQVLNAAFKELSAAGMRAKKMHSAVLLGSDSRFPMTVCWRIARWRRLRSCVSLAKDHSAISG